MINVNKILIILSSSFLFWIFVDVGSFISLSSDNSGDISTYHLYYKDISNFNLFEIIEKFDPAGFYVLSYILKKIGFSFEFFLFLTIVIFYIVTNKIFYNLTFSNKNIYLVFLILFSSFWMQSILLVTLRQGITYLIIVYFLFRKENLSIFKKILIIIIAANFHHSAIIFLPYLILERFALKNIKFINIIFIFFTIIYCFNLPMFLAYYLNEFNIFIKIDAGSLMFLDQNETIYKLGFSIKKLIASLIPVIAFNLASYKKSDFSILKKRIYFYYVYIVMLGMLLSGFIFHDRIFLYAWAISPILLVYSIKSYKSFFIYKQAS